MSIHVGTHVDCPYHFIPSGTTIDEMPLEKYTGPGVLVDLRGKVKENEPITLALLKPFGLTRETLQGQIVVFFTGWVEREFGRERLYVDNPYLSEEVARHLVECKVRAVAVDFTVDKMEPGARPRAGDCPIHRILLGHQVPLIENLINLGELVGKRFELTALPLKIYRGDGAATRAVARILD
jgi:kynurenine formamidase